MSVQPLTSEEAGNLEKNYDRLMQMAAELDRALYTVNLEMQEAYKGFLKVKTELDMQKPRLSNGHASSPVCSVSSEGLRLRPV